MSDLSAAAAALGAPEAIVQRSAEARAKASGISVDAILAAWAGGGSAPTAPVAIADAADAVATPPPETPAATAVTAPPVTTVPVATALAPVSTLLIAAQDEEEIPAAATLRERIRVAGRVGMLSGSILGVVGLLAASPWLLPNASILGAEGDFSPAVIVDRGRLSLVTALFSLVFGAIVAALSRTVAGWVAPGNALVGRFGLTSGLGALLGLVLGFAAGATLAAFGESVEGAENLIQLPVVAAIVVVLLGGALMGWLTAALVQAIGVPAGVQEHEAVEVATVQRRLAGAIGVPLAGLIALAVLVLPLAIVLIQSSHLSRAGAPILAIIASASILAVASLSASKPGMKISRGEFLLALGGIGVVLMIVMAVFLARSPSSGHEEEETTEAGATTTVVEGATTTVAP